MAIDCLKNHLIDWLNKILKSFKETSAPMIAAALIAGFGTFSLTDNRLIKPNNIKLENVIQKLSLIEERLKAVESEKIRITVSPDGKSYILKEEFDGTETRWIKSTGKFNNIIEDGAYYLYNEQEGWYAYSTVPINHPMTKYDITLDCKWVDGNKSSRFGILLYRDNKNLIRFNISRNGLASVIQKSKGAMHYQLVELDADLGEDGERLTQMIRYDGNVFSYCVGGRLIGKFNFNDFQIKKVGIFVQGKQKVGFDRLHITEG